MAVGSAEKRHLGQFFTREDLWLGRSIKEFILQSGCGTVYDPFAGTGDLLEAVKPLGLKPIGLDKDRTLGWEYNDSLVSIPHIDNAIIITNPPYLSNYSAKRRHILQHVTQYFSQTRFDDLYLLALENILKAQDYAVAIIPETFINSSFPKNRLVSVNILEDNPFHDTEEPICVACFDGKLKSLREVSVRKNDHFVTTLGAVEEKRLRPMYTVPIKFNYLPGRIGLRAVDTTNPSRRIEFMRKEKLDYDLEKGIKHSSRLITVIGIDLGENEINPFISACNERVERFRKDTADVLLSPFKGNMKNGVRRRRLDYETARAIMESAYESVKGDVDAKEHRTLQLFTK